MPTTSAMPVSWTNYRFTPPKLITESQFQVAKNKPQTHRYLIFDHLWQMFRELLGNAIVPAGIAAIAFVIVALLPNQASGLIGVAFSFGVLVAIGCTISVAFTTLSFILFAFHYAYYWQRVAATAAVCTSYDEFKSMCATKRLLSTS